MGNMENVISLITSITAIVTSVFSLIFNYVIQRNKTLKEKRVIPTISILDNSKDDIECRLQNLNTRARVFVSEREIHQLNQYNYLYICIYNYYEYKMINCVIKNNLSTEIKSVGVILPNKCVIIPVKIQMTTRFYLEMEYDTEENEALTYKLAVNVPDFSSRQDFLFSKRKKIKKMNNGLNVSINTSELLLRNSHLNLEKKE